MKITVSIMAHPKRKAAATALLDQLRKYPFQEVIIIWDELNDEWHTGERSIKGGVIMGGDWHIVIQDDAILTPNFYDNVVGAINNCPAKTLISLYTGTVKPMPERIQEAVDKAKYSSWLKHYLLFWGVGIVIPVNHIPEILAWAKGREEQYDVRIGYFYQRNMMPVFYTNPSLVDHDDEMGSLLDHGDAKLLRKAHNLARGLVTWNNSIVDI